MAECNFCKNEMSDEATKSCVFVPFEYEGDYEPIRFGDEEDFALYGYDEKELATIRCGDCNIAIGGYHHSGCDQERCPKCKGQAISCECNDEV